MSRLGQNYDTLVEKRENRVGDWMIKEWDGNDVKAQYELPGHMSEQEIETALQRLVCRDLSANEILAASRRRNDPMRSGLLISCGARPFDRLWTLESSLHGRTEARLTMPT